MQKKTKRQKTRKKSEFRYHDVIVIKPKKHKEIIIRHPSYIFLEKENTYIYVSITHSPKVYNAVVIKLRKNPNPKDGRDSYVVVDIKEASKDTFGSKLKGWEIDSDDEKDIREDYVNKNRSRKIKR